MPQSFIDQCAPLSFFLDMLAQVAEEVRVEDDGRQIDQTPVFAALRAPPNPSLHSNSPTHPFSTECEFSIPDCVRHGP
jgi:hypothetical protein